MRPSGQLDNNRVAAMGEVSGSDSNRQARAAKSTGRRLSGSVKAGSISSVP